jgi:hypothetical protein
VFPQKTNKQNPKNFPFLKTNKVLNGRARKENIKYRGN